MSEGEKLVYCIISLWIIAMVSLMTFAMTTGLFDDTYHKSHYESSLVEKSTQ